VRPRYLAAESTAMQALSREARAPMETPMRPIISQRSHWRLRARRREKRRVIGKRERENE